MSETATKPGRSQMWILFGGRDANVPQLLPHVVESFVNGIDARMVRRYRVARVDGDSVLLRIAPIVVVVIMLTFIHLYIFFKLKFKTNKFMLTIAKFLLSIMSASSSDTFSYK